MNLTLPLWQKTFIYQNYTNQNAVWHCHFPFSLLCHIVPHKQWCSYHCPACHAMPAYCCFKMLFFPAVASSCYLLLFVVAVISHRDSCSWCCSSHVAFLPLFAIHYFLLLRKIISPHWLLACCHCCSIDLSKAATLPGSSCHWNLKTLCMVTTPKNHEQQ